MDAVVPVRTVHGAAAACDHLLGRDDVDRAVGVGVAPPEDPQATRDAGEALNVLGVRLHGREVATEQRTGEAAEVVPAAVAEHGADAVVVAEGFGGLDDLRAAVDVPVTVVADPAAGE